MPSSPELRGWHCQLSDVFALCLVVASVSDAPQRLLAGSSRYNSTSFDFCVQRAFGGLLSQMASKQGEYWSQRQPLCQSQALFPNNTEKRKAYKSKRGAFCTVHTVCKARAQVWYLLTMTLGSTSQMQPGPSPSGLLVCSILVELGQEVI